MPYADLLRFNPWWAAEKWAERDTELVEFEAQAIKYFPSLRLRPGVFVLRGPRQVGKTTLVKLKIRELLEAGVEPKSVFFHSFELLRTPEQVYAAILEYLDTVAPQEKRYLFLDETTTIPDWTRAVKLLLDRGDLRKSDAIVVTGSSAIDLKKGGERLPGRGIEGNEYYYLPCSFRTYVKLKGMQLPAADLLDSKKFFETAAKNIPKILALNKEFASYLIHGGFMYAINHGVDELTLEKYARWLEGDFTKWGKNPLVMKEIVQAVIRKKCSQFSHNAIAKETSVTSHNTIIDYLQLVDEELLLKTANKATLPFEVLRRKEKKAFFTDPLLATVAERWAGKLLPQECRIEHAVASHLSRLASVFFYNDGRKEIDCLLRIDGKTIGVEVKWSDNISAGDTIAVKKASVPYVLSKQTLKQENGVPVIPASVFLACLDARELVKRSVLKAA